jgi:transcription elongation factor Elf1
MIRFACYRCNTILRAKDENAGTEMRCPNCKVQVEVPPSHAGPENVQTKRPTPRPRGEPAQIGTAPPPTITFRCPHCHAIQTFTMDLAGQIVKCPLCHLPFQIPVPQAQVVDATPEPSSELDFGSRTEHRHSRNNRGNGIVSLVLALAGLLLFFGMIPVYLLYRQRSAEPLCGALCVQLTGLLLGILGAIIGARATREDPYDGCAKAGYALGRIVIYFVVVGIAVCVSIVVLSVR